MPGPGWGTGDAGAGVQEWGVSVEWEQSFSLGRCKSSGGGWMWWLQNKVNVLNVTELKT